MDTKQALPVAQLSFFRCLQMRSTLTKLTFALAAIAALTAGITTSLQAGTSHVQMTSPCTNEVKGRCPVSVTFKGPITSLDADTIQFVLTSESKRTGKPISLYMIIDSAGGDVRAAMAIGRLMRATESVLIGVAPPAGRCDSACALVAAGAVGRSVWVGLHRPYFVDSSTANVGSADQRYKRMMLDVRNYLSEMNMPDEVFQLMQSTSPSEIRRLTSDELNRLGFMGDDPAYEESQIAKKAREYGLTSAEYRERIALVERLCPKATSLDQYSETQRCIADNEEAIYWGVSRELAKSISRAVYQTCGSANRVGFVDDCMRDVGTAVRQGKPAPFWVASPVVATPLAPPSQPR